MGRTAPQSARTARPVGHLLAGLVLASLWGPWPHVAAGEPPPSAKPPTTRQAADAVQAAVAALDASALEALAARDLPDPWRVADVLCSRGEHDAAEAFARAAPGPAVEKLPAYVAARRGKAAEAAARAALGAMERALAEKAWSQALEAASGIQGPLDSVVMIRIGYGRGRALRALGRRAEGCELMAVVGEAAERLGWLTRASRAYRRAGWANWEGARTATAWRARLAIERTLGDPRGIADALNHVGIVHQWRGDGRGAVAHYQEALALYRAIGDEGGRASALVNIGTVHMRGDELAEARASYEAARRIVEALGRDGDLATVLGGLGAVEFRLGHHAAALASMEKALDIYGRVENDFGIATTLANLSAVHIDRGSYAEALRTAEAALDVYRRLHSRPGMAAAINRMGIVQHRIGNYAEARVHFEAAVEIHRALGQQSDLASLLNNLGSVNRHLGHDDEAVARYEEALRIARDLGSQRLVADALNNLGALSDDLGRHAEAITRYEESIEIERRLGNVPGVIVSLTNLGLAERRRGNAAAARRAYASSLRLLADHPDPDTEALALWGLAALDLATDPVRAVAHLRQGVERVTGVAAGLAEGEGATARDRYAGLFDTGYRAARRTGEPATLHWFLEQGRAHSLREGLGSRAALEAAVVPAELREALALARNAEHTALRAYKAARGKNARSAALAAWHEAQAATGRVARRMEREAKRSAAVTVAAPDDLALVQGHLGVGDALVSYALTTEEAIALVVRPDAARIVTLSPSAEIRATVDRLLTEDRPYIHTEHVSTLQRLLIDPLALADEVQRVLVSPMGRLAYVPFALLVPDRVVTYVPSATAHGLLVQERALRGTRVLGLGDPAYGRVGPDVSQGAGGAETRTGLWRRPRALPGTRKEVEAIADVALLGARATERMLRAALVQQPRWRAVHLACHGFLDPERPMRSALAITPDADDDGFLTALEVFHLKVPADLVVLSACETGKGTVYRTEGIVGLTRAFMFAGAPRVLCSLWDVDDEATQALMRKFYELWHPEEGRTGLAAAVALKRAQAFVRSHEAWRHPRFWAAWVLWGLPD